jgi:hypothetical protein
MRNNILRTHSIITIQRPLLWFVSFIVIVAAILLSLWVSFEYGRSVAGYDSSSAGAYIDQLKAELEESEAEIIASKRRATMLKSNSRIDDDASAQLKETLVQAQDEVLALKKELLFYKSIVAPEKSRSLAIQTVQLKPNENGSFKYSIMISQQGRNDKYVRGTLAVRIKGVSKGKSVTLALSDVNKDLKVPVKFGFKYFQNFEGVMKLPTTFQPDYLQIVVKPSKGKVKAVDEQFAWSELTAGES